MNSNPPGIERLCWIAFIGITLGWFLAGLPSQAVAWLEPQGMIGLVVGGGAGMLAGLLLIHRKSAPQAVAVEERKDVKPH